MRPAALISRAARWHAKRPAVIDLGTGRRVSFAEMGERAARLANALRELAPSGARVGLLLPNRAEFVEWDLAIALSGMVKVPINPRLADVERRWILERSGAEILAADVAFEAFVASVRAELPALRHVVAIGGRLERARDHERLAAMGSPIPPDLEVQADAPSFILFTSGTTGRAKGATSSVRGRLAATTSMLADEIDPTPGDVMIHAGPLSHGSGSKILAYYLRGAANLLLPKFDPELFLWAVREHGGSATFLVPTMIAMLVDAARGTPGGTSSLRTVSYGGAPIAPERLREALDVLGPVFVQVYGSCEAPHPITVLRKYEHQATDERLASAGRETVGAEIRIVGRDGDDVPAGAVGELWIRSDHVMLEYWHDPEATAAVMRDGWYRSGDLARRDDEGFLYIVDRERDMIITGGLNVYPAEVEAALARHPAVAEVAVIGVPDRVWGESVKAFVVLRDGSTATAEDLLGHCRRELAGYKKPRNFELVESLPKGSTGKVLKRELRRPYWEGHARAVL